MHSDRPSEFRLGRNLKIVLVNLCRSKLGSNLLDSFLVESEFISPSTSAAGGRYFQEFLVPTECFRLANGGSFTIRTGFHLKGS